MEHGIPRADGSTTRGCGVPWECHIIATTD
jgi:hypothetical protein